MKRIANTAVYAIDGSPYPVPIFDEDGRVKRILENGNIHPQTTLAKVSDLLRLAVLSIPDILVAPEDSRRSMQVLDALERATDFIDLQDGTYSWLQRLLTRDFPLTKEQKDEGFKQRNYSYMLWRLSWVKFVNYLRTTEEQQNLLADFESVAG